ncbi:hypothetical protein BDFB_005956 [Asbolus verrucosus]|uniref:MICOS complex subunit MIC13 n=1 Tax=Asbolus verrucosus TaxID=1661398 RepID=A0A482VLN0_ASBVE|nr:hypothetical protein BDFB_005956 [Asbolus verrucosus]
MFRFSVKVGLAGGAVYYLNKEGVWKESNESLKAYDKLNTALEPYVAEVKKQIPFETPPIPSGDRASHVIKQYWNKGVVATFQFVGRLPHQLNTWTKTGINSILENPDVKKLFGMSASEETVPQEKKDMA